MTADKTSQITSCNMQNYTLEHCKTILSKQQRPAPLATTERVASTTGELRFLRPWLWRPAEATLLASSSCLAAGSGASRRWRAPSPGRARGRGEWQPSPGCAPGRGGLRRPRCRRAPRATGRGERRPASPASSLAWKRPWPRPSPGCAPGHGWKRQHTLGRVARELPCDRVLPKREREG